MNYLRFINISLIRLNNISHSFEKGDTTIHGFIRDYTKTKYNRAFYYGNLCSEQSGIERVVAVLNEREEEK